MSRRNKQHLRRFAIGSAAAAVMGYLAGVLTAPQSGKQTRRELKQTAGENLASAEKELKYLHTELGNIIEDTKLSGTRLSKQAKQELTDLVDKAKDTKEKAREVLSAIHEGDADDRDLQKAIKEANTALDHLRTYLKK